jgi:exodeoxyribonuclease VII large subunit
MASQNDRRIATVTQINNFIKVLIERTPVLGNIWIRGEISNLKLHSSGHIYMTLKDEGAVLRAVMFKSAASKLTFKPENGMKVLSRGRIGVFERDGAYQLYVEEMEEEGRGDLYRLFEELKKKLGEEGLFAEERKKSLPRFPKKIGIVTSPTGAAVRDIINILKRRYPLAEAFLYPALVQGDGASRSVCEGIEYFNREKKCDVLIVGRGGGSIEDLWAFNEEDTVRAISNSEIPVISAVGHETDFTLSDFAADLRAPTPSAAAEIAVPDVRELSVAAETLGERAKNLLLAKADARERELNLLTERASLKNFEIRLYDMMQNLDRTSDSLSKAYGILTEKKEALLAERAVKLNALSPLKVFERGYSIAYKGEKCVKSIEDVSLGDSLTIFLSDGEITSSVTGKNGGLKNDI